MQNLVAQDHLGFEWKRGRAVVICFLPAECGSSPGVFEQSLQGQRAHIGPLVPGSLFD